MHNFVMMGFYLFCVTGVVASIVALVIPRAQPLRVWAGVLGAALAYSGLVGGIALLSIEVDDRVILAGGAGIFGATIGHWVAELFPQATNKGICS